MGGLNPKEVYLADGDLLILKGGTTSDSSSNSFDNVWPAIDNYEAPYREPVFPPDPADPSPRNIPFHPVEGSFKKLPQQLNENPFGTIGTVGNDPSKTPTRVQNSEFRPSLQINPNIKVSGFLPVTSKYFVPGETATTSTTTRSPARIIEGHSKVRTTFPQQNDNSKRQVVFQSNSDDSNRGNRQTSGFESLLSVPRDQSTQFQALQQPQQQQQRQQLVQTVQQSPLPQQQRQQQVVSQQQQAQKSTKLSSSLQGQRPLHQEPNFADVFIPPSASKPPTYSVNVDSDDVDDFGSIFKPQNFNEGRTVIHGIYPKVIRPQPSPFASATSSSFLTTERRAKIRSQAQSR